MLTLLITIVIGIATYAAGCNGEWGSVAIGVLIILGAWFMKMIALMDDKAWLHRTEYWAMSGKDRAKARHRWEREAREEEERKKRREAERAPNVMPNVAGNERTDYAFPVCQVCGNRVKQETTAGILGGNPVRRYWCERCGAYREPRI
jgi:hypothetical protein